MPRLEIDPLLEGVSKPARYVGGEWNVIERPWHDAETRWALIYPDLYDIGQSNGGLAILYDLLNHTPADAGRALLRAWPTWPIRCGVIAPRCSASTTAARCRVRRARLSPSPTS